MGNRAHMKAMFLSIASILIAGCANAPTLPEQVHSNKFIACNAGEAVAPLIAKRMRDVPTELLGGSVTVRFNLTPETGNVGKLEFVSGTRELLPYLDEFERFSAFSTNKAKCVIGTFSVRAQ